MDIYLLFRKKSLLTEEGLPWLRGAFEHEFTARRNSSGRAVVSAVLVRSLLACLEGAVTHAEATPSGEILARVRSSSSPGSQALCAIKGMTFFIPHGEPNKITYHAGVLAMLRALLYPARSADLWEAYQSLQSTYATHGKASDIQECLCRACDELYYWLRYVDQEPRPENDLLASATVASNSGIASAWDATPLDLAPLTDPAALQRLRGQPPLTPLSTSQSATAQVAGEEQNGFVGWQIAVWHLLSEQTADRHAEPERVARKQVHASGLCARQNAPPRRAISFRLRPHPARPAEHRARPAGNPLGAEEAAPAAAAIQPGAPGWLKHFALVLLPSQWQQRSRLRRQKTEQPMQPLTLS